MFSPDNQPVSFSLAATSDEVTISWKVKSNDAPLDRVEIWRAPDNSGSAGTWSEVVSLRYNIASTDTFLHTGSAIDTPGDGGWWYGLHVVDKNGLIGYEPAPILLNVFEVTPVIGRKWYVSTTSSGNASGDSWVNAKNWSLLDNSLLKSGDTVFFDGGTGSLVYNSSSYTNNTNIAMMITADGTASAPIVFTRGREAGHNGIPIIAVPNRILFYLSDANYVEISYLKFRPNSTVMTGYHYGVTMQDNSSHINLLHNEFDYTYGRGVGIGGGIYQTIKYNYFYTQDVDGSSGSDAFNKQNDAIQGVSGREVEIAYNRITNSTIIEFLGETQPHRDLIQISQMNPDNGTFKIHHNFMAAFMDSSVKTHINTFKANNTQGTYLIYDNVIAVYNAGSDLSFDTNDLTDSDWSAASPTTVYPLKVRLYNNTFVYVKNPTYSSDVYFVLKGNLDEFTFKNNIWYSEGYYPGGSTTLPGCVTNIDYNQYELSSNDYWNHSTWVNWRATGQDAHSENTGVTFVNNNLTTRSSIVTDYALAPGSSGIDEGTNLSSLGIFTDDYAGTSRPQGAGWDVGAYER